MSDGRVALMIVSHVVYSIFSFPYLVPWSSNKKITVSRSNTTTQSKALTNGTEYGYNLFWWSTRLCRICHFFLECHFRSYILRW
jgi:hypothetical protein